ncbi:heme-binding protein [Pseudonocardia nematodicida]|uniref:Heme-binding protein n=1 Tax=Pseudonocardia nematodicida TaxID=1206997 RepID=A0ABV1KF02_9PSEU
MTTPAAGPTVVKPTLSLDGARTAVDAALAHARALGVHVAVAVLDEAGHLLAFVRMDGAPYSTIQVATDKAYTAASTRKSTADWFETLQEDAPLRAGAVVGTDRLIVFGGGQPIEWDGVVVGAIGVSGSHWTNDTEIGSAGIAALRG